MKYSAKGSVSGASVPPFDDNGPPGVAVYLSSVPPGGDPATRKHPAKLPATNAMEP